MTPPIEAFKAVVTPDLVRQMILEMCAKKPGETMSSVELMRAAFEALLIAKSAAGELACLQGVEGHSIRLAKAWDALATPESTPDALEWAPGYVTSQIMAPMTFRMISDAASKHKAGEKAELLAGPLHAELIATVEAGDLPWWASTSNHGYCQIDGQSYAPEMKGWSLTLGLPADGMEFVPIKPIGRDLASEKVTFDVGSGDLLISGAFKIPGLDDLVRSKSHIDVASAQARHNEALRCLADHGFLKIPVGNAGVGVYLDGDQVLFGSPGYDDDADEDVEEPKIIDQGHVDTRMWVTVIAREKLVALASQLVAPESAAAVVDKALAESDCVNMKVEPGLRHVYFNGDFDRFSEEFYSSELSVTPFFIPSFALTTKPLTLDDKPAPAAGLGI